MKLRVLFFVFCLSITASDLPTFEVASVKPANPNGQGAVRWFPSGRMRATNVSLRFLLRFAYDLPDDRILGGPKWMNDEPFDIEATARDDARPEANNGNSQVKLMLRSLIADRFYMRSHFEKHAMTVYAMTIAKSGFRMTACDTTRKYQTTSGSNGELRSLVFECATPAYVARNLSMQFHQSVVDQTGIQGAFDGKIEWLPDLADSDSSGPSIFTAVQEQLGLKLDAEKMPVDVLVIDDVQKPSIDQ